MTTKHPMMEPHRPQWKSSLGFLLAAVGSAVGLGNFWRFPYLCYENGGGAFLIPYGVALITAGIPLLILEFGIGHQMRGSAPMAFAKIHSGWEWLGWWMVVFVMFGIVLYYAVVIAWCLCYLVFAFGLSWGSDPNTFFFQNFLGVTQGPHILGNIRSPILLALLVVWLINWLIVFFGVEKGLEKSNKVFVPILFGLVLVLVIWSAQLPGAWEGILRYLKPDFDRLGDWKVWMDAYSQVFFSLGVGFGIMVAYASYLPRRSEITLQAWWVGLLDTSVAFVAGLAVFGTLGYMSQTIGKPLEQVVDKGIGLAFVAYPQAIGLLPAFRQLFGVVFFLALTLAGITSSISIVEAFASAIIDKFHYPRKLVTTVLAILGFLGGLVFTTGGGLAWLDIVDHVLGQYGLVLACLMECLLLGWVHRIDRLRAHLNEVSTFRLNRSFDILIRVVIPAVLIVLLAVDMAQDLRRPYGGYPWVALLMIGRDWLLATLLIAFWIANRPWHQNLSPKTHSTEKKA
jgi:NSS family neurotransmitter:Na+ symporter